MLNKKFGFLAVLASSVLILAACNPTETTSSTGPVDTGTSETPVDTGTSETPVDTDTSETPIETDTSETDTEPDGDEDKGHANVDVFDIEGGTLQNIGEDQVGEGKLAYWAGDGGSVSGALYDVASDTISMSFTTSGATSQFYSVQLFYKAPYLNVSGMEWNIKATINSSVAGAITVNGQEVTLIAGDNNLDITTGLFGKSTLSIQMGVNNKSVLGAATLNIKGLQVIDTKNTYYKVDFQDAEGGALDSVYALKGNTLWTSPVAPAADAGEMFVGWVDVDNNLVDLATYVPTKDTVLKASYATSDLNVSYYVGDKLIETVPAISGQTLVEPDYGYEEFGFGYGAEGWYTDAGLTDKWSFAVDKVSESFNLYAKTWVEYSDIYQLEGQWLESTLSHGADGELIYSGDQGGWAATWNKQINFRPVPVGIAGTTYTISFEYKANAAFPVHIFDDGASRQIAFTNCTVTNDWVKASLTYQGGTFGNNTKLSFEFGTFNEGATNEFSLRNITLTPAI